MLKKIIKEIFGDYQKTPYINIIYITTKTKQHGLF